jgi:hypothetical protein
MPQDRSQETDTERGAGLLTEKQRRYLRGEKEYDNAQSERDMRYKIRERIKNGLLDFCILAKRLQPRDRKQIFKDVRSPVERGDTEFTEDEILREDELSGIVHAMEFLYLAAEDAEIPFERAVELGVRETKAGGFFTPGNIKVTVDEKVETDHERIFEKIENEEPLMEFESMALASLAAEDLDRYVLLCKDMDVDVKEKLETDEPLSVGESYVLFGLLSDDGRYGDYDVDELVHDEVRSRLGPHSV